MICVDPTLVSWKEPMNYRYYHVIVLVAIVTLTGVLLGNPHQYRDYLSVTKALAKSSLPNLVQKTSDTPEDIRIQEECGTVNLVWYGMGGILGGFACVGFRRLKERIEAARYFGVSVATAFIAAPGIVHHVQPFNPNRWYDCLLVAGVAAFGAWFVLEILTMLGSGFYKAVQDRGITGFREQLLLIISLGTLDMRNKQQQQQQPEQSQESKK